ncbi:MAG TPA: N-acetylglucosamine-6-phosphate deacetylase [Dehalococcoidia bacterium]|nr:N-acetylglucosamine-6-phosphate deacetylase [Dehalococcoidia bacterium]
MPPLILRAQRVITPDETIEPGLVLTSAGIIEAVGSALTAPDGAEVVDLPGQTLVPGFIDVHVHGGGGFSLATSDPAEITAYSAWAPRHGVTSFLAGIVARAPSDAIPLMEAALAAETPGAELLGLNLEGPFVSPDRRGALPPSWPAAPDAKTLDQLLDAASGRLRLVTVAPELPGALNVIRRATAAAVRVSIGHTDARYETALAGFQAGASHVTHAFNAMRPFHHRDPGPVGAALDSPGVTIELIADGVHLHPATVRMLIGAFGPDRVALITDAVTPAGLDEGRFRLGGQEARLQDGRVTLPDGTIAGSAATMDDVVASIVRWGAATLTAALRMAATVPAAVAGVAETKGRLAPGYDADIVALAPDLTVAATWIRGNLTFQAQSG